MNIIKLGPIESVDFSALIYRCGVYGSVNIDYRKIAMFQLALDKRIMVFKSKTYEDSLIIYGFRKSGLHHSFDPMLKISFRMVVTISIAGYVTKKVK